MNVLSRCLITLAALALLCGEAFAANLLANGDFEEGEIGPVWEKLMLPGWPKGNGNLQLVAEPRPESKGKLSLKIVTTEDRNGGGISSDLCPMDPRKPLKLSGWIREEDLSSGKIMPYVGIAWFDEQKQPIVVLPGTNVNYQYISPYRRQPDWQQVEYTAPVATEGSRAADVIPKNAAYFQIWLFVREYVGTVWFDDFILSQDEAAAPPAPAPKGGARK